MANEYGVKLSCGGLMVEKVERKDDETVLQFCYRIIGCDTVEIVNARNLESPYCIVVDEEGLIKSHPMYNIIASHMYGACEHGQALVGNAIIMKNEQRYVGIETVWLSSEEADAMMLEIHKRILAVVNDTNDAIRKGVL